MLSAILAKSTIHRSNRNNIHFYCCNHENPEIKNIKFSNLKTNIQA